MDALDLDIENYNLDDLLQLFKLDFNFQAEDLKRVKKTVMATHPDKSALDKKYFLFFTAAYKIIYAIYNFRHRSSANQSTEYKVVDNDDHETELLLKKLINQPNFNTLFNDLFEKHKINDEDSETGYGDWLKSNDNMDDRTTTMSQMSATFEQKKKEIQELVPFKEIEDVSQSAGHFDLTRDKPSYYSSAMFSNLPYEDLKKAHIESVVPVTHADYLARPKYKNVLELQQDPEYKDTAPLSLSQATEYLSQRQSFQNQTDVQRAYKLAKQDEHVRKANQSLMSNFRLLTAD
jgi:hypothetical protein